MKNYTALIYLFLSFLTSAVSAQNPIGAPLITNYGKNIFQGGSRTWDIGQDEAGVMYFGNNEGLLTFDGTYWKQYKLPNQTIVRSLYITDDDKIFVGGQGEFGYFEKTTYAGLVYNSLQDKVPNPHKQFADVWRTTSDGDAVYFMSSNYIFAYKNEQISVFPAALEWVYLDRVGDKLYAQDRKTGLLTFRNNQWSNVASADVFAGAKIAGMIAIHPDSILIGMLNNKTLLFDGIKLTAQESATSYQMYTPSYAKLDTNTYVIATATEGFQIRDVRDGRVLERIGITEGLQNKNVTAVFVDRQRNIWATVDNAIAVISYGGGIRYIRPNIDYEVTGYSTKVFDNKLYLSSTNGVYMAKLDKKKSDQSQSAGHFVLVKGSDEGEAWRLDEVNGQLLLAHNNGLFRIDDDKAIPLATGTGSWLTLPLSAVYPITYSLVGNYHGLDLLTFNGNSYSALRKLTGTYDSYRFLELDDNNIIWASHPYRGIYQMKLSENLMSYDTQLFGQKDGLPSTYQNYVFKLKNKVLFATEKGVYEFDSLEKKFKPFADLSVFDAVSIKYMKEDKSGNIWFCSDKKVGFAEYNASTNAYKIIYFPEIEGMNTSGFENIYPFDNQNIYIGSEKGAIHINLEHYQESRSRPNVLISTIISTASQDSTLYGGQSKDRSVSLPASFDSFHFEYSSTNYGNHAHVTYSYWLEGFDKNWSPWSTNTEKDYTNIPSGTYAFKVKAKNNLNEESEIITFHFLIRPPWYKSIWAYILYSILFSLLLYYAVILQKKAWAKQQVEFEKEMEQLRYIHQLEVDKNEKEIVKLQNEKLENEVLSKTKELASTSMQLMENSGALSKLRIELAKLEHVDDGTDLSRITSLLKDVENNTAHWDQFASHFDELNDGFFSRLKIKQPNLSRNDLKVCAYLRLNFTTKQIAQLQSISVRGVEIHRYRLRKKLGIPTEISLSSYLEDI